MSLTLARPAPPGPPSAEPPGRGFVDCRGEWHSLDDLHDEDDA